MEKISDIRNEWQALQKTGTLGDWKKFIEAYATDKRSGVQAVVRSAAHACDRFEAEEARIASRKACEAKYRDSYRLIAGIDEVGRGPLAGPVVTCAVILPPDSHIHGVNDSKKLTAKKREALYPLIMEEAVSVGFGWVWPERIDAVNILNATYEAMRQSIAALSPSADLILADAVHIPGITTKQIGIIHGDAEVYSIGAASILAKVERDRYMDEMDTVYPGYGFAENKGYGTEKHIRALQEKGPCPIHRKSFIGNFV